MSWSQKETLTSIVAVIPNYKEHLTATKWSDWIFTVIISRFRTTWNAMGQVTHRGRQIMRNYVGQIRGKTALQSDLTFSNNSNWRVIHTVLCITCISWSKTTDKVQETSNLKINKRDAWCSRQDIWYKCRTIDKKKRTSHNQILTDSKLVLQRGA